MRKFCLDALLMILGGMAVVANTNAAILFEDNFDSGVLSPAWTSKAPSQWVEDGWLHQQDINGWPRDALVETHDSDPAWRDYALHVTVDTLPSQWEYAALALRTNGFYATSDGSGGSAYVVTFRVAGLESRQILLNRFDFVDVPHTQTYLALVDWSGPTEPFDIVASVDGGHIQVSVNGQTYIDLVDPDPLPYGGIGFHTIWETHTRFDNVLVEGAAAAVPEPGAVVFLLAGMLAIGTKKGQVLHGYISAVRARALAHGQLLANPRINPTTSFLDSRIARQLLTNR